MGQRDNGIPWRNASVDINTIAHETRLSAVRTTHRCEKFGELTLNQCWNIVNWTLRNKLQWNYNQKSYISIPENPFENTVSKMAAILSRSQCVKQNKRYNIFWYHDISYQGKKRVYQRFGLILFIRNGLFRPNCCCGITTCITDITIDTCTKI